MQRHHRNINSPFELQDRRQFHTRKVLHDVEDGFFVSRTIFDVAVAFIARKHDKAVRFNFLPKGLVIQWLKPVDNIVYMFEIHNDLSLANRYAFAQIPHPFVGSR